MSNKLKIFILFIVVNSIGFIIINSDYNRKVNNLLITEKNKMNNQYKIILKSTDKLVNIAFEGFINNDKIISIFSKKDREGLKNSLNSDYINHMIDAGFYQVHFHLPNNKSFLRLHKQNKYGDDLTDIRYSVEYVNKYKKKINGWEMGRVFPGLRYVFPLTNGGKHIGSVETSISIEKYIKIIEETYNVETHFLIKKDVFDKKIFQEYKDYYKSATEHKDYIVVKSDSRNHPTLVFNNDDREIINARIKERELFNIEIDQNHFNEDKHTHMILTFLPLKNIEENHIGYLVFFKVSKELRIIEKELYLRYILFSTILIIILFLLYREFEKTELLKKSILDTEKTNKKLDNLNNELEYRVAEEVLKNTQKELHIFEQAKMASLGEMIGNIAHQWKQPLSIINAKSTRLSIESKLGILTENKIEDTTRNINKNIKYLSETIDTFKNYIKEKKELTEIVLQDRIEIVIDIVGVSLKDEHIELRNNTNNNDLISIKMVTGELDQVIMNIINNSKDILLEKKIKDSWIQLDIVKKEKSVIISIEDNGGGIPEDIISKIFEPYFTTKDNSKGTGLGLYMSYKIINNSLKGTLTVKNTTHGAKFFIEIPL